MIKSWFYTANKRKIRILKEYNKLLEERHLIPKQAALRVCKKYGICRKTIYNYIEKFKDIPI